MPPARDKEESAVDLRIYLGMLLFRWQIIVVCFIYALLAGVVYIQWSPKKYSTFCRLMLYREREVRTVGPASPWASENAFLYMLRSAEMQGKVVQRLYDKWGRRIGSRAKMWLPVTARWTRALGSTLDIWITSEYPKYAEEYLRVLLEEVQTQWESMERQARDRAVNLLESELARLQEKIREAENELIEYQRLHDIARVEAKMSMETRYLNMLIAQRSALQTEMMLLEQQHPFLKEENIGVIVNVDQITRDTAALVPPLPAEGEEEAPGSGSATELEEELIRSKPRVALATTASVTNRPSAEAAARTTGWQNLRVRLAELQQREQELLTNLKPEHPSVVEIRKQIAAVQTQLRTLAKIQLESLRDRYRALQIALNAIEAVEYKWQLKHLFASQKRAEMNRIAAVVNRFEGNYRDVYNRLHDLKVSEELKAYHFSTLHPPRSSSRPVWPDAKKILLMACALGLGGGVGLALLLQVMDNKIQSIKDVEQVLGIPFLGGVPFWVHSGLEKSIRPIVTEERATGAIEAYRALRTSIVSVLQKVNEKIVIVTSADSREGKTLTVLNLAIMMAEMKKKVLLIDMDLRRGRLHRSLGLEREPGVSDVLSEGRSLRDVIQKTRVENLYLAPTGRSMDNSAELFQSSDLVSLLVEVQDDYDYILMDSSPVLRVTDTVILATQGLGVVVYVARVNHTPKPLIRYSLDMLGNARILGLIMNSIEMHKISSLYYAYQYPNYAYYSNAYAYGYSYYHHRDETDRDLESHVRYGPLRRHMHSISRWFQKTFFPL